MMKKIATYSLCLAGILGFAACNNDSDSAVSTGYLYDDVVGGLEYSTESQSGITGSDGSFKYRPGEKVTFKLGNLTLGKATSAGSTLTLFDLATSATNSDGSPSNEVVNMALLLQSLDSDQDPNNGITIDSTTRAQFKTIAAQTLGGGSNVTQIIHSDANLSSITIKGADVATDHLLTTVAKVKGATGLTTQTYSSGNITEVIKYTVDTTGYDLDYALNAKTSKLPLAVGSGLRLKSNSNGTMVFYGITDRGANGDAPEGGTADVTIKTASDTYTLSKSFPIPAYAPKIAEITVKNGKATVTKTIDLKADASTKMSGLPLPIGTTGSTSEVGLSADLKSVLPFDVNGIDPEGIDIDGNGNLWISDEYGPFIAKVDPTTGIVLQKFIPGDATNPLPDMLKNRVPNRGMEGLSIDQSTGLVYAIVQTPLDTNTDTEYKGDDTYLTLVELNPATKEVNLYAVPFDKYNSSTNPTGFKASKVKVGDLTSLGNGKFLMIEQGSNGSGDLMNNIVLFDISGATKIDSSMYAGQSGLKNISGITPATRTFIANLRDFGWLPEKAEGLTLIDSQTIAISNDNDFGMAAVASCKVSGVDTELDPKKLRLDLTASVPNQLSTTESVTCDSGTITYGITKNSEQERRTRLWVIKLSKPATDF
ncbi:MAG: esterase-like activity of phytase family protein [Sulfuricurvum sp.]